MKKLYPLKTKCLLFMALLIISKNAISQISITSVPYNPGVVNFNTFNPNSALNAALTIPFGWSFSSTGVPTYNGQSITGSATGGYWAYTFLLSGDYNLGGQRNATAGNISYHVNYVNNTGGLITSLVLSWNYEQWHFANLSGWSCSGTGALAGNTTLATKGYIGANWSLLNTATQTPVTTFTLSGLAIANGATFGISWVTSDDAGADNGVAIDDFSMIANATPSITLANTTIPAANVYQNTTNNILYKTDVTVGVSPATLNTATFTTGGTYASANLTNLKLWYSQNNVFSTSNATLLSTISSNMGPGAKTFSGLSKVFPVGNSYLFLTADVPCATTSGNTINVSAISTSNFTFATGTKTGSGFTAGGNQTISNMSMASIPNQTVCSGKSTTVINFAPAPSSAVVSWNNTNTSFGIAASGTGNIASVSPTIVSNQTANITATITVGSCTGTSSSFSIIAKSLNQSTSVWTGTASTDWSDSNNWTNCVCGVATDATIASVSSPNFNPVINTTANVKNIIISAGATLSVQSTQALNVHGNWLNNGTFTAQKGSVVLSGASAQTIGGSSQTSFFDLTLNNSSGASLSSPQQLRGNLLLSSGVFNTNNQFTLAANATESGRIGSINANADIINKVVAQQYAPGGTTGWALFGSPLSSALTMADWNDNFAITCLTCPNGYYNFPSIYTYKESIPGDYSAPTKYIPITAISDPIHNGVGYWVYLGNGSSTTSAINFDVAGNVAKSTCLSCTGAVTIPLSFTSNNGVTNDGWNLISNPLPSPISWTALRNGNANVDNAIYVYNTDLNGGLGGHASYVNGVSSNTIGGVNDNIAMCQGFYVHARAATSLTAGENIKTNTSPTFLKSSSIVKPIVRLVLSGSSSFQDMTTFYFEQGGATSFQYDMDAYKMNFDESTTPYIGSMSDSVLTSISGLSDLNVNMTIPVKAMTPFIGSFTFSSLQENFPTDVCVTLYDTYTGITTNILTNDYACTLYDTTSTARFIMSFFTTSTSPSSNLTQPFCTTPNGGIIKAQGTSNGPWNYEWSNGATIVKTSLNMNTADSLTNLAGGFYSVKVSNVGGCDHASKTFVINTVVVPTAAFAPDVFTTYMSNSGEINFTNSSSNSQFSSWNFGDNLGTSNVLTPTYHYTSPGTYTVTLITQSSTFCKDTSSKVIQVVDDLTGISSHNKNEQILLATISQGNYELLFSLSTPTNLEIRLTDIKGTTLKTIVLDQVTKQNFRIDLEAFPQGLYTLSVNGKTIQKTFKLIK